MVSVQPLLCPVAISAEEIPTVGSWQTMIHLSAYTINPKDYPEGGFFVTFMTMGDDKLCGNNTKPTVVRYKSFEYEITSYVSSLEISEEIALTFLLVLGTSGTLFMIAFCYFHKTRQPNQTG